LHFLLQKSIRHLSEGTTPTTIGILSALSNDHEEPNVA